MAKNELIKDFDLIRDTLRQFYVYGFKTRNEYDAKSSRTYDNECRLMANWLEDYMSFRQVKGGKSRFITIDSASVKENPFYRAFKAKSFTDKTITLHFCLMDILSDGEQHSLAEISDQLSEEYSIETAEGLKVIDWDESTLRKKLQEYSDLGLVEILKEGKRLVYRISGIRPDLREWLTAIAYFSEVFPVGVVGSYILDKYPDGKASEILKFKHHYLLDALDSQILYALLHAIRTKCAVELYMGNNKDRALTVLPLKIYIGTQTGRSYLLAYNYPQKETRFYRLDRIRDIYALNEEKKYEKYLSLAEEKVKNCWGVSHPQTAEEKELDRIELIIHVGDREEYIIRRLEREKRGGRVERIDDSSFRFTIEVTDASELFPWLRTFIGRIVRFRCSNPAVTRRFFDDIREMAGDYGGGV